MVHLGLDPMVITLKTPSPQFKMAVVLYIMLWGCLATSGTGSLHRIEGTMKKEDKKILEDYLKKDVRDLGLGRRWWFQRDKHKLKLVTAWLIKYC